MRGVFNTDVDDVVTPDYQSAPDLTGALNKTTSRGHIHVTGIYRYLDDESDGSDGPLPGYGATAASEIGTGKDMRNPIQHQFVGGEGIATCLVSLSGLEYNWGRKETTHVGSIDTGEEVLSRLERSRNAQRISFGLFFNY